MESVAKYEPNGKRKGCGVRKRSGKNEGKDTSKPVFILKYHTVFSFSTYFHFIILLLSKFVLKFSHI